MMYDTFTPVLYWSVVCLTKHRGMLMDNYHGILKEEGTHKREEAVKKDCHSI